MSRRGFLKGAGTTALGAGALAGASSSVVLGAGADAGTAAAQEASGSTPSANFGRMFPNLPPFAQPSAALTEALTDIGKPGGVLDAKDNLAAGPIQLIVDPALNLVNRNNDTHTAGTAFFGQFLDHDLTFDATSPLGIPTEPTTSPNARTPILDLDSLYGSGPVSSPQLYQTGDKAKLRIESGGQFEDVPREPTGRAIIGDPRNDENLIISGLHAAFILFHNRVVDLVRSQGWSGFQTVFAEARKRVVRHYQWIVVKEFLPLIVGQSVVDDIFRRGRRFYRPSRAFMPVEFQGAAYRFGHSMIRPSYRANLAGDNGQPFFGMIFDPAGEGQADPVDLRGGARAARRFIGWGTFFDFQDGNVKPNKRIDAVLSTPLFNLPLGAIPSGDQPTALPQRNLLRHVTWSLPSGQAIANAMGVAPLSAGDLSELAAYGLGLDTSTPLWYYVLKEAQVRTDGLTLGPVGGRIVAEVFIGVLLLDGNSYLNQFFWRPSLPQRDGRVTGNFRMVDLLTYAKVDPVNRGQ
ncbi:MAG TPA: heme peroxidase family protein [Acidimicrobiales bacterium]